MKKISIAIISVLFQWPVCANIIRVPGDAGTIQSGIDLAQTGDTVLVLPGTYSDPGNIDLDTSGKAMAVISESGALMTVIDCDHPGQAHRGFYFHQQEGIDTVIRGFTIQNGWIETDSEAYGGGILCENSNPSIENCRIIKNRILGGFMAYGGGIACINASPLIFDCVIQRNSTYSMNYTGGGGVAALGISSPVIMECTISENRTQCDLPFCMSEGGGIYCAEFSEIVDCIISENEADAYHDDWPEGRTEGGGVFCRGSVCLENCLIWGNDIDSAGGGAGFSGGDSVSLGNCTIVRNPMAGSADAIRCMETVTVINSILWDEIPIIPKQHVDIRYSCVLSDYYAEGEGNISTYPKFVDGFCGSYYLSQEAAGQSESSLAVDAGSGDADQICYESASGTVCMDQRTTRTDIQTDSGIVDMGFHYCTTCTPVPTKIPSPSHTPAPTKTPTPSNTATPPQTPTPVPELGVHLELSQEIFHAGDEFRLTATIGNPGPEVENVPLVILLDVEAAYFWYPSWTETFEYKSIDMNLGTIALEILKFSWPDFAGSAQGIRFYGALLSQDLTAIIGEYGTVGFGWSD